MIATKESFEPARGAQASRLSDGASRAVESSPHSSEQLPGSKRVYVTGKIHPDVRVPMREIELTPTKVLSRGTKDEGRGEKTAALDTRHSTLDTFEANEPVRVYDCAGPWGDPEFKGTVEEGLPALRRDWILKRGDVEECEAKSPQSTVHSPQSVASRCAPNPAKSSPSLPTPVPASSRRKWNSSLSAKT